MIALIDGMPLVSLPDGSNCLFDKRWIIDSIQLAAERSGHGRWWLAGHIAESVALYLHEDFEGSAVKIPELQDAVIRVLSTLGFGDIAEAFELTDPPEVLSLADLARQAGTGYELAFFGLLGDRMRRLAESKAARLEIRDLSGCVRMIGKRRGTVRGLREEIVGFIRHLGEAAGKDRSGVALEIQLS
jgi:hypothetical protein